MEFKEVYNFYAFSIRYALEEPDPITKEYTTEEKGIVYGESYSEVMQKLSGCYGENEIISVNLLENLDSLDDVLTLEMIEGIIETCFGKREV